MKDTPPRGLILAGIIAVVAIFIIGLVATVRNKTVNTSNNQENESSAQQAAGVVITGTGDLANILLTEQFLAVRTNLVAHLKSAYPKATTAAIVGPTTVNNDGSISFNLQIPTYNKTVSVNVVRLVQANVTVLIPDDNYNSGVIQVYTSSTAGD